MSEPQKLRARIRAERRALSTRELQSNSYSMARLLASSSIFRKSHKIALYLEADGEIAISEILPRILKANKRCYLPVLRPMLPNRLWFCEYREGDRLIANKYGIFEPDIRLKTPIQPWSLDIAIMPLVAFDIAGNRIGMGGGYYDRTFAYLLQRKYWRKPKLVGAAHDFQLTDSITRNVWDVPMDAIVTEKCLYKSPTF